jgi:hypothetical protein
MEIVVETGTDQRTICFAGGLMRLMKHNRKIWLVVASLFLLAALPAMSFAQGRGRGQEKKLDRFVNGHDARDGRWDGRGPGFGRRAVISNRISRSERWDRFRTRDSERNREFRNRELRRRNLERDNFLRAQRMRYRNRYQQRSLYRRY